MITVSKEVCVMDSDLVTAFAEAKKRDQRDLLDTSEMSLVDDQLIRQLV